MLKTKRIAVIGMGKMGGMLTRALIDRNVVDAKQLCGTTGHPASATRAQQAYGIEVLTDNVAAVEGSDLIILSIKPQTMNTVLKELKPVLQEGQVIVSLAAATDSHSIEQQLPASTPVIRAMPNLPCLIGHGMTVLCPGKRVKAAHLEAAQALFSAVGRVAVIDNDALMDAVTALSGSGPAYGYIIIESLAEGGVKVGLPRSLATTLAAQTLLGAAAMVLETGEHPAKLKDMVTTPAGTTVDGLMALEEGNIRVALIKAIDAATAKGKELSKSG